MNARMTLGNDLARHEGASGRGGGGEGGRFPEPQSGSLDVEHEFPDDMKVRMTGAELAPEAEATWVRPDLNGSHGWDDGRYTLRGGVGRAMSGESYEVGGGVSLEVRFRPGAACPHGAAFARQGKGRL